MDDTIILGETYLPNVVIVENIIMCFELAFGLKANFFISCFGVMDVENSIAVRFERSHNCNLLSFPFT